MIGFNEALTYITFHSSMLSYRTTVIERALQPEQLLARKKWEILIKEEVANQTIRTWLELSIKRYRTQNTTKQNHQF